jgi:hypothetical protein
MVCSGTPLPLLLIRLIYCYKLWKNIPSLVALSPLEAAIRSLGSPDNCQQLNVVPIRMVQWADLQSDLPKYWLRTNVQMWFQRYREDYRRTTSGTPRNDWTGSKQNEQACALKTVMHIVTDLPFYVFIPVVCWAPVDLDPREMVTPGSSNR